MESTRDTFPGCSLGPRLISRHQSSMETELSPGNGGAILSLQEEYKPTEDLFFSLLLPIHKRKQRQCDF